MSNPAEHWSEVTSTGVANAAVCVGIAAMPKDRERAAYLFTWATRLGHPGAAPLQAQVAAHNLGLAHAAWVNVGNQLSQTGDTQGGHRSQITPRPGMIHKVRRTKFPQDKRVMEIIRDTIGRDDIDARPPSSDELKKLEARLQAERVKRLQSGS